MHKKYGKMKLIIMIAVILSLCTITGTLVLAKYINQKNSAGLVGAKHFYFTSNLLDGKTHTFAPGIESVTFTLGNHIDDLRCSELNIEYNITVTNGATIDKSTGILEKDKVQDIEVTISNLKAGEYIVTATGNGGYTKTLTATIVVSEEVSQSYYFLDTSSPEYITLTVWNEGDKAGLVTITYTGIPDNTNPNMADWRTNESKQVEIGPHESKVFRFFSGDVSVTGATPKTLN